MGFILSKFRRKKTTNEQLESIEERIQSIQNFQLETEQQFRRVVGKLVVTSVFIYIVAVITYYYCYSPETLKDMINFAPLLLFPIVIIFFRRLLSWYYRRKLSKNETMLKTLKADKKKILEEVMDKETYKKAKEILEKYAPDQLGKGAATKPIQTSISKAAVPATPLKSETIPRQRMVAATPADKSFNYLLREQPALRAAPNNTSPLAQPKLSLPRPILQRDRGVFDKLIDLIIGDGPNNRYALICRVCSSHNGMALKHEFEYMAFRCAYCLQWNPARKQKPHAPNLLSESGSQEESDEENSESDMIKPTPKLNPLGNNNDENETKLSADKITNEEEILEENPTIEEVEKEDSKEENEIEDSPSYDANAPVAENKIDLLDLHQALEEIEEEITVPVTNLLSSCDNESDINQKPIESSR